MSSRSTWVSQTTWISLWPEEVEEEKSLCRVLLTAASLRFSVDGTRNNNIRKMKLGLWPSSREGGGLKVRSPEPVWLAEVS